MIWVLNFGVQIRIILKIVGVIIDKNLNDNIIKINKIEYKIIILKIIIDAKIINIINVYSS